jgi:hypothetical protein
MRLKALTISFPFVYSLMLHAVVACLVLMMPIYGSSSPRSFMSYLVFLTGGEEAAPSSSISGAQRQGAGKVRALEKSRTQEAVRPEEKETPGKAEEASEENESAGPAEEAVHSTSTATDQPPQEVPPKTADVKTDTAVTEEVVKNPPEAEHHAEPAKEDLSSAKSTPSLPVSSVPPTPAAAPQQVAGTEQFFRNVLPDTETLLRYQAADKSVKPPAAKEAKAPVSVSSTAGRKAASRPVSAPPQKTVDHAEQGKAQPGGKGGEDAASKMASQKGRGDQASAAPPGQEDTVAPPLSGPG